jgi:hypothetical protein
MFIYYTYAYLSPRTGLPYYIGKGSFQRAWNPHSNIRRPNDTRFIVILEKDLSEIGALALERRYIAWYGKRCNGTGILMNVNDGGDGNSGHKHSSETKQKLSIAGKGRPPPNKGRPHSEETKEKIRAKRTLQTNTTKGRPLSEEHKAKLRVARAARIMPPLGTEHRLKIKDALIQYFQSRRLPA